METGYKYPLIWQPYEKEVMKLDFKFIKQQIAKIVGDKYVSDDLKDLTVYSRDYSSMPPQVANVVAAPGCTEKAAARTAWLKCLCSPA